MKKISIILWSLVVVLVFVFIMQYKFPSSQIGSLTLLNIKGEKNLNSGESTKLQTTQANDQSNVSVNVPTATPILTPTIKPSSTESAAMNTAQTEAEESMKIDSGRYQGQADNNFIEIKISGVPDEKASKVFMITDVVRKEFEKLQLKKDDVVKITYVENKYGQLLIYSIEKI